MTQSLEYYIQSNRWWVESFLAMPDHWHALIRFHNLDEMEKTIRDWKRYVAKQSAIVWQDGFFEHRIRSRQNADEKWHYILLNPVRRGLVADPHVWPYVWFPAEAAR